MSDGEQTLEINIARRVEGYHLEVRVMESGAAKSQLAMSSAAARDIAYALLKGANVIDERNEKAPFPALRLVKGDV